MTTETTTNDNPGGNNPVGIQPTAFDQWVGTLADDQKAFIEKNGYKDFSNLLSSDMAAMQKLGVPATDLIVKPKAAFAEDPAPYVAAMRALGAPEDAKGYGEAPALDGLTFKDGAWDKLTGVFAQAGVPPFLIEPVLKGVSEIVKAEMGGEAPEVRMQNGLDALKGAFGAKADAMLASAKVMLEQKADPGFVSFLEETGYGNDPRLVEFLSKIHADYAESGLLDHNSGLGGKNQLTPEQAREELRKLEADQGFMGQLNNKTDPNHRQAVDRRLELIKLANP